LKQLEKDIQLASAIAGFVASGGKAENVDATVTAAELDHENNWIWLAVRAGVFAWTVYEVVDAANSLSADFDRLFADGELSEAEAQELKEAATAVGINIIFEVTAGKVVKGMKVAAIAGDFSVSVAKKLGLDKVLADLNKKMGGVGAPNSAALGFNKGRTTGNYDAMNPGPLDDNLAGTFSGGRYQEVELTEDVVLYRAGSADAPLGQFFTQGAPQSVIQTRIDSAVLPQWPGGGTSPIESAFEVRIPAGTKVYVGEVSSQGGAYVGGTQQIVVPKPWTIEGVQVIGRSPLP
jgi:hypothetical protein